MPVNREVVKAKRAARRTPTPALNEPGGGAAPRNLRLLVVVDTTAASKRVLQYVGQLAAGCDRLDLHLAFIASHPPAGLLETGGSELPEREARLGASLRKRQRGWMAVADEQDWRVLRAAKATLQEAGVAVARISAYVSSPLDARSAVDEVFVLARDHGCGTVVVGHRAHSWLRGLGGGDLADQLVRRAKGYAVWVIL